MNWKEIVEQHTIPAQTAPEVEQHTELDAETEAMFAAGVAEDARYHQQQQRAWEKTDPDLSPARAIEMEAGE